jgi:hypothetical protein
VTMGNWEDHVFGALKVNHLELIENLASTGERKRPFLSLGRFELKQRG